jgi:phospholipid-binding lipoprotein MlaA
MPHLKDCLSTMARRTGATKDALIRRAAGVLLVVAAFGFAGCATPPAEDDAEAQAEFRQNNDPFEPANRAIFSFNERLDKGLMRRVAEGYRAVVPGFGRQRVGDFLNNLNAPLILLNDVLQAGWQNAAVTTVRFVLNSTFGVFGIMDVATPMGFADHKSDFGQTFALWGTGEGPYLMLPVLGPSNPRDALGLGVGIVGDPLNLYLGERDLIWLACTRRAVAGVSEREAYLDVLDDVRRASLDYYATLRSLYRQRRNALISGAKPRGVPPIEPSPAPPEGQFEDLEGR